MLTLKASNYNKKLQMEKSLILGAGGGREVITANPEMT
jgi:hypothetical protein